MAEGKFVLSSDEKAKNELLNKAIAYAVQKHWDGLRNGCHLRILLLFLFHHFLSQEIQNHHYNDQYSQDNQ